MNLAGTRVDPAHSIRGRGEAGVGQGGLFRSEQPDSHPFVHQSSVEAFLSRAREQRYVESALQARSGLFAAELPAAPPPMIAIAGAVIGLQARR